MLPYTEEMQSEVLYQRSLRNNTYLPSPWLPQISLPKMDINETTREAFFQFGPCTFCGGCDLSESNEEDCLGKTFPICGGCLWAQGMIH